MCVHRYVVDACIACSVKECLDEADKYTIGRTRSIPSCITVVHIICALVCYDRLPCLIDFHCKPMSANKCKSMRIQQLPTPIPLFCRHKLIYLSLTSQVQVHENLWKRNTPVGTPRVKVENTSSVSPGCRNRRLNGAVCRNYRIKRVVPCRCRTGTLKNPTKCLWRLEPDRRYNFFSPPAHLCRHIWL